MPTWHQSVCPHDCPSTCALEVEVLPNNRIGSVRGAEGNSYTSGVVCTKVARYSERIHHPDRLLHPLLVSVGDVPREARPTPGRLARSGEAGDSPIAKAARAG